MTMLVRTFWRATAHNIARSRVVAEEGYHDERYHAPCDVHGHWRLPACGNRPVGAGSDRGPRRRTARRSHGIHRLERRPAWPAPAHQARGPAGCRSWRLVFEWRADNASLGKPKTGGASGFRG